MNCGTQTENGHSGTAFIGVTKNLDFNFSLHPRIKTLQKLKKKLFNGDLAFIEKRDKTKDLKLNPTLQIKQALSEIK